MAEVKKVPFSTLFSTYIPKPEEADGLRHCMVTSLVVNKAERSMEAYLEGLPEVLTATVQNSLKDFFHMNRVMLHNKEPVSVPVPQDDKQRGPEERKPAAQEAEDDAFRRTEAIRAEALKKLVPVKSRKKELGSGGGSTELFGRVSKKTPVPMRDLQMDMGLVMVEGDVISVEHRELKKRGAWVVCFDITDYTNSVRVSKFMPGDEAQPILSGVKQGQHLQVQGYLSFNRFEGDMVLEPTGIISAKKAEKQDLAEEKRVELHLHTRMSMMDALTDTKTVVKRAIAWGHPAIAITDHGVLQSFPDACNAAKGSDIKILYGVEAYYRNDVDERVAVHGSGTAALEGTFVVFDIETTGLSAQTDSIIEIGAVKLENGVVTERFGTFADPGHPVSPETVALTGITDAMLKGAPSCHDAVAAFLDFAGDAPLVAHNAEFDTGFIAVACRKMGRTFQPLWIDTLILAQYLLPNLKNHKLDTVAAQLQLPPFNHHRAEDDAETAALILAGLFPYLKKLGVDAMEQVNGVLATMRRGGRQRRSPYHLILLAKNQTGLRNLYKLVSFSHLEHYNRVPIMPKSVINENREGLIIGSACEAGELFQAVTAGKQDEELMRIAQWYDYLEIQPIANNAFMLRPDKDGKCAAQSQEELRNYNRRLVDLGKRMGKPVCATGDVHFLNPEDEVYRHILLTSKDFPDADAPNPLYFRTTDEMLAEFSYLGGEMARRVVVEAPRQVADWCEEVRPLPSGLFTPKLENSDGELKDLVWGKVKELYGDQPPQLVIDRVNAELTDIINCKYDVIYMSAQKLVQNSLENGYLVGSRGSVGSSIVAFMSGITEVNSLPAHYRCPNCKHADFEAGAGYGCGADMEDKLCPVCGAQYVKDGFNIPFETFLGFGGDKVPDIDLNFSGEYQAKAHKYTFELFGQTHVFRAGTIGTVAEKTAYGYVKKYLELRGKTVNRAEETRLALGCTGVKRTTGQHPGGMVVIPQDKEIYDFCPVQHPADDKDSDIITTHFEYHSMESNLLKLDMLGHDDPSMIRMLQDLTGVDPQKILLDDKDTMSLFTTSQALGFEDDKLLGPTGAVAIPEFGTTFVRGMLEDTQPEQFDILVRLSGFSHGTDVWLGNAKDLIVSGTATVGQAIGCRDDIMLYLISRGMKDTRAFKIMEAVRKGKGLPEGAEGEMKALGVPDWYIDSCKKIKYLFPKAHAVAYVMMAFRIAWFKVHKPLAFYAAYFSIRAKAFDEKFMCRGMEVVKGKMREIQAKKNSKDRAERPSAVEEDMLVTLEVCYEFYLRGFHFEAMDIFRSHATRFLVDEEKGTLLPPLISVAGLGESVAQTAMENRSRGGFVSIDEVASACKLSKSHVELLKDAGAFGNMPENSQISLF
ncbi:MAG: polC [Oscillospiraceae bacterium]|nr:polC [Oscillospiraceae bacterium]